MSKHYRLNVAALIYRLKADGKLQLLLGRRRDFPSCWQWPQGGVDEGESLEEAFHREVFEETGLKNLHIVAKIAKPVRYEFNEEGRKKFKPYKGQEQVYFIAKIPDGEPTADRLDSVKNKEFTELKWKNPTLAVKTAPAFKAKAYKNALKVLEKLSLA
ncbi:MAG: hypothetical protein CR997_12745 [Acidobacteria bacterium]|nr:MAG: hypothetical protein CR997_12745 [Acidobacteriota bacterium]